MPTQSEKKALLFVAAVLFLGTAVRVTHTLARVVPPVATREALDHQIKAVERVKREETAVKAASRETKIVNVNSASLAQLQSLPRVGPALAQRIIAYRDSAGPFASLEQLDNVKGVGPALLKQLAPRVTFSPEPRPNDAPSY